MSSQVPETISEAQKELFNTPKYSDLVVKCGSHIWHCHQAILCPRCPFFKAACDGAFKEAEDQTIDFPEDPSEGIRMMLVYLYTLELPDWKADKGGCYFLKAFWAYSLGDKYGLPKLRKAGHNFLLTKMPPKLRRWRATNIKRKNNWLNRISQIWRYNLEGSEELRDVILKSLTSISATMIADRKFRLYLQDNHKFMLDYVAALGERAAGGPVKR